MASAAEELIRLVGTLGLVVGGVLVAGRVLRRTHGSSEAALRVLGRLSLGKGGALLLVAVGSRRFLVGTGERGPRVLAELDGDEVPVRSAAAGGGTAPRLEELVDLADGPGTGLVEQLRRMTLRTSGRSRATVR
jgi:flagellar biogenesis protein FliO